MISPVLSRRTLVASTVAEHKSVQVTAELQMKRFRDRDVETNRYTAELTAATNSPHAFLIALTEVCAQIEELRRPGNDGELFIIEIRLHG